VVAQVIQVTVSMRSGATVTLLAAALIQRYATRTGDGCVPLSVHASFAGGPELCVISGDDRIAAAGDESRHVERSANGRVAVRRPRSVPLSRLIGPTRPGRRSCGG